MFHFYGLLIGLGILISAATSAWLAKRRGLSPDIIWNGLWWVVIPAIIGARTYHVAHLWSTVYAADPLSALYLWNGGLALYGALAGGFLGLYLYWRFIQRFTIYDLRFTNLLNIAIFGLPLGQVIGRFGNYVNEELYGLPSSLPWAIPIDVANRVAGFEQYATFHPLFLYEMLWVIIGFSIMFISELLGFRHLERSASRRRVERSSHVRRGDTNSDDNIYLYRFARFFDSPATGSLRMTGGSYAGFYLIWYGIGRFFLEFLRFPGAVWTVRLLNVQIDIAQLLSFIAVVIGANLFLSCYNGSPDDKETQRLSS